MLLCRAALAFTFAEKAPALDVFVSLGNKLASSLCRNNQSLRRGCFDDFYVSWSRWFFFHNLTSLPWSSRFAQFH